MALHEELRAKVCLKVAKEDPFVRIPSPVGFTVEYGEFCVRSDVLVRFEVDTSMGTEL